jgi:hypothetical protein
VKTFMATYDGKLEPGGKQWSRAEGWPTPWGLRCDSCGRVFPYGCCRTDKLTRIEPPQMRAIGSDGHRCAFCEGYVEQLGLFT